MLAFSLCLTLYAQAGNGAQTLSVSTTNLENNFMQALDDALSKVDKELLTALPEHKTIAILPLPSQTPGTYNYGSNDYLIEKLTNILTKNEYKVAVAKEDKAFAELVKQVVWSANKSFTSTNAEIIKKIGQMKNAQVLLYGSINRVSMYGNHISIEVTLYAIDVDNATHLWGNTFKGNAFIGKDIKGIVDLPTDYMKLFANVFDEASNELKHAFTDDKINKALHTIAILPINGDIDQYVTAKAREMFTRQFNVKTIESNIPTIEQALTSFGAPDKKLADSIFWGSIRDISTTYLPDVIDETTWTRTTDSQCKRIEVELNISEVSTGTTIWTRTFSKEINTGKPVNMTYDEIKSFLKDKYGTTWWFYTPTGKTFMAIIVGLVGLYFLVIIIRGVLIVTRPR